MRAIGFWFLLASFCLPVSAGLLPIPVDEENLFGHMWKIPSTHPPARLEALVQRAANVMLGKGFRYIGVEEDWFHGHLLYERRPQDNRLYIQAILYHTQEDAHSARWEEGKVDAKYDYLNHVKRNWIQWLDGDRKLDGLRVEDAIQYLDDSKKDPAIFEHAEPRKGEHYTIHSHRLDPEKLGFLPLGDMQFDFRTSPCDKKEDAYLSYRRGPIRVYLNQVEKCLMLSTHGTLWEFDR